MTDPSSKDLKLLTAIPEFRRQFVISDEVHSGFIALFHDRNPLHCDPSFARSKGFSDIVMHGNILGGFLSYFIGECLPTKNVIILSQSITYLKPAHLNDVIEFVATICNVSEAVRAVEFSFSFRNAKVEKIARGKISIGILP